MAIRPPKVLVSDLSNFQTLESWPDDAPVEEWPSSPFRWTADIAVQLSTHSGQDSSFAGYYTGLDVNIGDWISTTLGGRALRIIDISAADFYTVSVTLEDVDRYNTFNDPTGMGDGSIPIGQGFIFEVNENGLPILSGIPSDVLPPSWQADILSRFDYRNEATTYIKVDQTGHTFALGDIVAVDPNNSGSYIKAADPILAIGVVNSIGIPAANNFTFRPFGDVIDNITPDLVGNYGDIFYMDPAVPGRLTKNRPLTNIRPIYLRLESPNRGVLFASGTAGGGAADDSTKTLEVVPTQDQVEFTIPLAREVLVMSINGVENNNFVFNSMTKVLTFDPVATGYGVDPTDEVFFVYNS